MQTARYAAPIVKASASAANPRQRPTGLAVPSGSVARVGDDRYRASTGSGQLSVSTSYTLSPDTSRHFIVDGSVDEMVTVMAPGGGEGVLSLAASAPDTDHVGQSRLVVQHRARSQSPLSIWPLALTRTPHRPRPGCRSVLSVGFIVVDHAAHVGHRRGVRPRRPPWCSHHLPGDHVVLQAVGRRPSSSADRRSCCECLSPPTALNRGLKVQSWWDLRPQLASRRRWRRIARIVASQRVASIDVGSVFVRGRNRPAPTG